MLKKTLTAIAVVLLVGFLGMAGTPAQKDSMPKTQDKLTLGENDVKQLLLLMDTDQNGKISKQEWMGYMSSEFDRLDKDNSGQLDPKELEMSSLRPSRPYVGK